MKKFSITNLVFITVLSATANAGLMKIGTVTAILTSQKTAEIQIDSDANLKNVKDLLVGNKQTNCDVKVKKHTAKIFLVDISSCSDNSTYAVGSEAFFYSEDYIEQEPAQPSIAPPSSQPIDFVKPSKDQFTNFGGGLRTNNVLKFEKVKATSGSSSEVSDLEFEADSPSFFLDFNHINARQNSWGWMVGLSYWRVGWDTAKGFGDTLNLNSVESSILNLYGSAVYRFTSGFIQFGLNGSSISSKNSPFLGAAKGSIGAQLGGGFFINDNLMFAIESKAISYGTVSYWSGADSLVADESGFYSGLNLGLYFTFN